MQRTLLLVVPPQRGLLEGFSTGLIAIANYVAQREPDVVVRLLDFGAITQQEAEEQASLALAFATGPVFVGITGTTASYQSMLATARCFKRLRRSCVVVLGGHHVSAQDDVVLANHGEVVDFVVRGEGEAAVLHLIRHHPYVAETPNLSFVQGGRLVRNGDAPFLTPAELDTILPEFQGGGLTSAPGKFDHVTYVSARGCPLQCAFCVVRASTIRAKSISSICADIRHLVEVGGYRKIAIEDNFFAHQPRRTIELCRALGELRQEIDFSWDCQTRVESMKRNDIVEAMVAAGCTAAYLGVESLVPKHLVYLRKTPDPERYLSTLQNQVIPLMLRCGLAPYLNLQLALPGETSNDHATTLNMLEDFGRLAVKAGHAVTVFPQLSVIYPGTPHFDWALERGDFGPLGRDVFEAFTAWEAAEEPILRYLSEHFAHGVGGIPLGLLSAEALRRGAFEVSATALAGASTLLRQMEGTPGVHVFRYGSYLAAPGRKKRHA